MKNRFLMLVWKVLINIVVVSLTVYLIHSLFNTTVTNAIIACGIIVFIIGLMSLKNEPVYTSGTSPSGLYNSMFSPPAKNVMVDGEAVKAEKELDPEYVNHDRRMPFLFKRSNFELIGTGVILIALGFIMQQFF